VAARGFTSAATLADARCPRTPSKRRSVVRKIGMAISGRSIRRSESFAMTFADSPKSTASMGSRNARLLRPGGRPRRQPKPDSVAGAAERETKFFSQRLSRLVIVSRSCGSSRGAGGFARVAITEAA